MMNPFNFVSVRYVILYPAIAYAVRSCDTEGNIFTPIALRG